MQKITARKYPRNPSMNDIIGYLAKRKLARSRHAQIRVINFYLVASVLERVVFF